MMMTIWRYECNSSQTTSVLYLDDCLGGASGKVNKTQSVDWVHPKADDDYSEDNFDVENTLSGHSIQKMIKQANSRCDSFSRNKRR